MSVLLEFVERGKHITKTPRRISDNRRSTKIGCVLPGWGRAWQTLTAHWAVLRWWLDISGGPWVVCVGFVLCLVAHGSHRFGSVWAGIREACLDPGWRAGWVLVAFPRKPPDVQLLVMRLAPMHREIVRLSLWSLRAGWAHCWRLTCCRDTQGYV